MYQATSLKFPNCEMFGWVCLQSVALANARYRGKKERNSSEGQVTSRRCYGAARSKLAEPVYVIRVSRQCWYMCVVSRALDAKVFLI